MRIVHHVAEYFDPQSQAELAEFGIHVSLGVASFDIAESDLNWPHIKSWIASNNPVVTTKTEFSRSELQNASMLEVVPSWHHGYPMSDDDDGYLDFTYGTSRGCEVCGVGRVQQSPFRMKSEPKWGKKHILQLNWIFDEYFALPEVYQAVFKPFGVDCREVLHHRTGKALKTVVQLVVDHIAEHILSISDLPFVQCENCRQVKFVPHTRGFFPSLKGSVDAPIFKTQEYFGSGASAWRAVCLSSSLYRTVTEHKVKGIEFKPLAV